MTVDKGGQGYAVIFVKTFIYITTEINLTGTQAVGLKICTGQRKTENYNKYGICSPCPRDVRRDRLPTITITKLIKNSNKLTLTTPKMFVESIIKVTPNKVNYST